MTFSTAGTSNTTPRVGSASSSSWSRSMAGFLRYAGDAVRGRDCSGRSHVGHLFTQPSTRSVKPDPDRIGGATEYHSGFGVAQAVPGGEHDDFSVRWLQASQCDTDTLALALVV